MSHEFGMIRRIFNFIKNKTMKANKIILACCMAALGMTSCTTVTKTASSINVDDILKSRNMAELSVQDTRISYTFHPVKSIRRGGLANIKAAAVSEALKQNGGADVLVEPQFEVRQRRGLFGKKVKYVTVTGYPAKYVKFETVKGE